MTAPTDGTISLAWLDAEIERRRAQLSRLEMARATIRQVLANDWKPPTEKKAKARVTRSRNKWRPGDGLPSKILAVMVAAGRPMGPAQILDALLAMGVSAPTTRTNGTAYIGLALKQMTPGRIEKVEHGIYRLADTAGQWVGPLVPPPDGPPVEAPTDG